MMLINKLKLKIKLFLLFSRVQINLKRDQMNTNNNLFFSAFFHQFCCFVYDFFLIISILALEVVCLLGPICGGLDKQHKSLINRNTTKLTHIKIHNTTTNERATLIPKGLHLLSNTNLSENITSKSQKRLLFCCV